MWKIKKLSYFGFVADKGFELLSNNSSNINYG
jgi:hypothetical protein